MKSSCIAHPAKEPLIIIREWQIEFCRGNVAAAALLSFFEYWHNIKLEMSHKNRQLIEVADAHGETIEIDTSLYQWHTRDELAKGIMGIATSKNTIKAALDLLVELKVISIHNNPNPKFKFDRTHYFLFYPEVCETHLISRPVKNDPQWVKNEPAITETTTENKHISSANNQVVPTDNLPTTGSTIDGEPAYGEPDNSSPGKENKTGEGDIAEVPTQATNGKRGKKPAPAAAPPPGPKEYTPAQQMFSALTKVCRVDLGMITAETRGMFNQAEKKMRENGYTPQDVFDFEEWWYKNDWRGKQEQSPSLTDIRNEWGKFKHDKANKKQILVFK